MSAADIWEVYALRCGAHAQRTARDNFLHPADPHDGPAPLDYFIWLLRNAEGRCVLVDTGFDAATAQVRQRTLLVDPVEALARFGVPAEAIGDVIITHLHFDHAGNVGRFPNARFHLQDREMAFATGRCMCHRGLAAPFAVEDVVRMVRHVYSGNVCFHDGAGEIAPGVDVLRVGGHSDGLQIVNVQTARGRIVLASDAAHLYANIETGNPFPIVVNVADMMEGWRAIRALAGGDMNRVIPGHDPLVRQRYRNAGRDGVEAYALHEAPRFA